MKSWTFETTSTSSMKSFGNDNQGMHDGRVQFEVDRLSRRSRAIPEPWQTICDLRRFHRRPIGLITGLSHTKSSVVSRKSLIFEQQNSKSAQTFRGVDPPMHHLSRAIFSSRLAQGCGYGEEITVFVFLKTFFCGGPHM